MHSQLTVQLQDSLKLDPERPEYHRALVGTSSTSHIWLHCNDTAILTIILFTFSRLFNSRNLNLYPISQEWTHPAAWQRKVLGISSPVDCSRWAQQMPSSAFLRSAFIITGLWWKPFYLEFCITKVLESFCLICPCPLILCEGHGQPCEWHRGHCHPD